MRARRQAEEWRHVPGFRHYQVSDSGRVRNCSTGKLLFGERDRDGYRLVNMVANDGKSRKRRVHRLVCEAFHGPAPEGCEVGHRDGVKSHNAAGNLRWVTRSENGRDKARHGYRYPGQLKNVGPRNPAAKLTAEQVVELRQKAAAGRSGRSLAAEYGISSSNASRVIRGAAYAEVENV